MAEYQIPVVVPSAGRAGKVPTLKAVAGCVLAVPAGEAAAYAAAHPGTEVVAVPETARGISRTRQWVYDRYGDVMMMDDDLIGIYCRSGVRERRLPPAAVREVVDEAADVCRQLGAYLFGFAVSADQRLFQPNRPFALTGFVNGHCLGLLRGSRVFFHPEAVGCDDQFVSMVNAHYHRYCFMDLRFGPLTVGTFKTPGGAAAYRTAQTERDDYLFMVRMFGPDAVRLKSNVTRFNLRRQASSPYARMLIVPF